MVFWERDCWRKWWEKRERDCCDCDCDCTWTKAAIWLAVLAVTAVALALLILAFAVVKPPTATADDALLTRFQLSPSPNNSSALHLLSYNATVTVTLRNPNLYRGIAYGALPAAFSFNGTRFDESGNVPAGLDQAARKETAVRLKVGGVDKPLPKLPSAGVAEFTRQMEAGVFEVEVRLDTVMQYKGRKTKCPLGIVCPLRLQLVDPDVAATAFQKTKCTILRAKTKIHGDSTSISRPCVELDLAFLVALISPLLVSTAMFRASSSLVAVEDPMAFSFICVGSCL